MHNYEITVTPLSEEARAHGSKPFTEQVDAYVLGAIMDEGDETCSLLTEVHGPEIAWTACVGLVKNLMKISPERTAAALATALDLVKAENGDKTMH